MKNKNVNNELFSEEDFEEMRKLGISEDEIDTLKNADAIKQTVDLLPDEKHMAKFMASVRKTFANKDIGKELMKFLELSKKDPEYFLQVIALFEVSDINDFTPKASIEKVSVAQVSAEVDQVQKDDLKASFLKLMESIKALPEEEKKRLLEEYRKK